MANYTGTQKEETLKSLVREDYFSKYGYEPNIDNIDFVITDKKTRGDLFSDGTGSSKHYLWAESKKGTKEDIFESFVQLILTIGKARTFENHDPPNFLGAFDAEKIAFIPYHEIQEVFYQNDFNWNVAPWKHDTKEFKQVYEQVKKTIMNSSLLFSYDGDSKDLQEFIKSNFIEGRLCTTKVRIDKNNFIPTYNKWLRAVKPTIGINWENAKRKGIIDGDFYLADLLSNENTSIKESLFVVLVIKYYEANKHIDDLGLFTSSAITFTDGQKAHTQFWNKYERPPKEEYWDYIINRRDLLVPQDIRERKGSFFTPQIWVELSQKYIADVFGENWQDEYYVWDCAAGTGNLLAGLTNKYKLWASTIDKQDVDIMHDRIKNGANLLADHVFQFDFLNDDFSKLPKGLQDIIGDKEKCKKLIVYINPPYAETDNRKSDRSGVKDTHINELYKNKIGKRAMNFSRNLWRESTLKYVNAPNFVKFREYFKAIYKKGFIVPANTFDNVTGKFPIGFLVWDIAEKQSIDSIDCDVIDHDGNITGKKKFYAPDGGAQFINDWISGYKTKSEGIGILNYTSSDMQQHNFVVLLSQQNQMGHNSKITITNTNLIEVCIYFAVRHCIEATWLNDRDQFLCPNDDYKTDVEFQNDSLAFTLFHGQNRISSSDGTNCWIPFTEQEVNARDTFESHFMQEFIAGIIKDDCPTDMFHENSESQSGNTAQKLEFSCQAADVFNAGRELWRYYHAQPDCNVNASFYDIRAYFQGRKVSGSMNTKSTDETYNALISALRCKLKVLTLKIQPKVYEYGFLKELGGNFLNSAQGI